MLKVSKWGLQGVSVCKSGLLIRAFIFGTPKTDIINPVSLYHRWVDQLNFCYYHFRRVLGLCILLKSDCTGSSVRQKDNNCSQFPPAGVKVLLSFRPLSARQELLNWNWKIKNRKLDLERSYIYQIILSRSYCHSDPCLPTGNT